MPAPRRALASAEARLSRPDAALGQKTDGFAVEFVLPASRGPLVAVNNAVRRVARPDGRTSGVPHHRLGAPLMTLKSTIAYGMSVPLNASVRQLIAVSPLLEPAALSPVAR